MATPPGTVQFLANKVLLGNDGINSLGILAKLHGSGLDALNATLQYKLTQFNQALGVGANYAVIVTDATGFGVFQVQLFDNGTLFVVVGSTQYDGTWTPVAGQDVLVHYFTVAGVPRLFLDGVEVTLVLFGPNAGFVFPEIMLMGAESPIANSKAAYDFVFVNKSPLPPEVNFCCPDGVPSRDEA